MNLTLHVWRQKGPADEGRMERYEVKDVNEHASFLDETLLVPQSH